MDDLISVIIPTYRRKEKLFRVLKSVIGQSYKNFEILVVNDDDKDNYLENEISEIQDDRIKVLNNEGVKGANGARNTGVINSKGDYLAFLDDDDEWLPNYLSSKIEAIKNTDEQIGLVLCNYFIQTKRGWRKYEIISDKELFSDFFSGKISIGASSNIFIKREVIDKVGLWDNDLLRKQDVEFLIRVLNKYQGIIVKDYNLKVYGHNMPKPEKVYKQSEVFIDKIEIHLSKLSLENRKQFYSNHYRRQANLLVKQNRKREAIDYWSRATKYKYISIRKDGRIIQSLLSNLEYSLFRKFYPSKIFKFGEDKK